MNNDLTIDILDLSEISFEENKSYKYFDVFEYSLSKNTINFRDYISSLESQIILSKNPDGTSFISKTIIKNLFVLFVEETPYYNYFIQQISRIGLEFDVDYYINNFLFVFFKIQKYDSEAVIIRKIRNMLLFPLVFFNNSRISVFNKKIKADEEFYSIYSIKRNSTEFSYEVGYGIESRIKSFPYGYLFFKKNGVVSEDTGIVDYQYYNTEQLNDYVDFIFKKSGQSVVSRGSDTKTKKISYFTKEVSPFVNNFLDFFFLLEKNFNNFNSDMESFMFSKSNFILNDNNIFFSNRISTSNNLLPDI